MKKIQNTITKKGLIIGIIFLFLTISFSPIINADSNSIPQARDDVPITILEYKADGTVERTVTRMPSEQADAFRDEIRNAQDLDTKLSIYKKYNLIPQDITIDTLQAGMQEKAQRIGLTQEKLERMVKKSGTLFNKQIYVNLFCIMADDETSGKSFFLIPFGTSFITYYFFPIPHGNGYIPSFDVLDYIIGGLNDFRLLGALGSFQGYFHGTIKIIGFVGFMYQGYAHNGMEIQGFAGFAAYVRAIGTFYC